MLNEEGLGRAYPLYSVLFTLNYLCSRCVLRLKIVYLTPYMTFPCRKVGDFEGDQILSHLPHPPGGGVLNAWFNVITRLMFYFVFRLYARLQA